MNYWQLIRQLREAIEALPPSRHRSIALTELENVSYRVGSALDEGIQN